MPPETLELLERIFQRSLDIKDGWFGPEYSRADYAENALEDINNWTCQALMDEKVRVALQRYEGKPQDIPESLKILARAA